MSRVNKRKHVMREMLEDNFEHPTEKQEIVRIICSRGNNLHEVESSDASQENYLITMPVKFRNNIWIKRGDFIIVEQIDEGKKVKAELVRILTPEHIKEFQKDGIWPEKFSIKKTDHQVEDDEDNDDSDLFKNTNRPNFNDEEDDDESESNESENSASETTR